MFSVGLDTRELVSPETFKVWQRVIRDALTWILGMFIVTFQLLSHPLNPNIIWVTTGVTLMGIPPALRINERRQANDGDKS